MKKERDIEEEKKLQWVKKESEEECEMNKQGNSVSVDVKNKN